MPGPGAAVVGTGFGGRVHVPALRAAGFTVAALVGRDADRTQRRAARFGVRHGLASLEEALALPDVGAVTIATPPHTHAELAIAAVQAGKHVICEKPFALDAGEAEAMLAAAEAAGVTHLVGHEFRWATDRAVAGRAIAEGLIGEPRLASFLQWLPLVADPETKVPSWWFDRDAGGGWLGASGSHVVDQVRTWLGETTSVSAHLALVSDRPEGAAEDSFTVRLGLRSGAEAVLQQTAGAWGPAVGVTRVAGTRGTVWLDDGAAWVADAAGSRPLPVPPDLELPPPPAGSDDPRHRFTHLELGPYTRLCEVLRAGVDGRRLPTAVPVPTFADGVACMRVLDAIRASAARGGETERL
ncbi:MAG TPA: Gfo/Idh/MocA family oxidoreductase [Acidimicrobiia bacterium]|nr:Gfo/Idh/MocA family oxidoreductase [Acidimicrobiia bacterium]